MYLHYTPRLLHHLYPRLLWHMPRSAKTIYLTFDDGPIPEVTPQVLAILQEWGASATFFCVGDNIRKHPEVLQAVAEAGHRLGNHTFHHVKGTSTPTANYLRETAACQEQLLPFLQEGKSKLFRPPYGRFTKEQRQALQQEYNIVMWDVLSADFDTKLSPERCLQKSIYHTRPGSIVIFHDSLKAWDRLHWVLPRYLKHFKEQGYTFAML